MTVVRTTVCVTEDDKALIEEKNIRVSRLLREALELMRRTDTRTLNGALIEIFKDGGKLR